VTNKINEAAALEQLLVYDRAVAGEPVALFASVGDPVMNPFGASALEASPKRLSMDEEEADNINDDDYLEDDDAEYLDEDEDEEDDDDDDWDEDEDEDDEDWDDDEDYDEDDEDWDEDEEDDDE